MPFVIHLLNSNQCKIIGWNFTNKCCWNSVWGRYSMILLKTRETIFPTSKCICCCVMCIQLNIKIVSNQFKLKYAWVWCKFNDARRLEGASYWYSIWLPSTISHLLYSIEWRNLLLFNGIFRKSTHINWNVSSQNIQAPRNKHLSIKSHLVAFQWIFMWLQRT